MSIISNNLNELPSIAFAANPIVVRATCNPNPNGTMPRVVCVVTEQKETDGEYKNGRSFRLTYPVSSGNLVATFNIGDTLLRLAEYGESYQVVGKTVSKTTPSVHSYKVEVFDEYFLDGHIETGNTVMSEVRSHLAGGFGDMTRLLRTSASLTPMTLSRKPKTEKEHICRGFRNHYSTLFSRDGRWQVGTHTEEAQTTNDDLCVLDYNPMMHHPIVFRNSFGELESCLAICREEESVSSEQSRYVVFAGNDYNGRRTQLNVSSPTDTTIKLSTGGVSPQWARWWAEEPLSSLRAWIWMPDADIAGRYVPCVLSRDGSSVVLNRKNGASEITFTATLDWRGGLL